MDTDIRMQVKIAAAAAGLKLADVARSLSTTPQHLNTLLSRENLRLRWVERIAGVIGVRPSWLLVPPGTSIEPAPPRAKPPTETVHDKVRVLSARRDLSVAELARRIGMSRQALNELLRTGNPSLGHVRRIADALDVPPADLLRPVTEDEWADFGRFTAGAPLARAAS